MTDPTITIPSFGLYFGAKDGPCGLCPAVIVDSPYVGVVTESGAPVCEVCANKYEPGMRELAEAVDQIDTALSTANPNHRPSLVGIAEEALNVLAKGHGVAGYDGRDLAFAIQVAERAMTSGLNREDTISLVGALCPDLPTTEFMQAMQEHLLAAADEEAKAEAEIPMLQCAQLVLGQAPGPTLGEAVDQLGIDFDQFVGIVTAQAAAAGVSVENLPAGVIDECVAAAKNTTGGDPA